MEELLERYRADRKKLMKMNRVLYNELQYCHSVMKRSLEGCDKMAEKCGELFSMSEDEEEEEEAESESDDEEASFSSSDEETKKRKRGEEEGEEEDEEEDDDSSSSSSSSSQCSLSKLHQDSSDGE